MSTKHLLVCDKCDEDFKDETLNVKICGFQITFQEQKLVIVLTKCEESKKHICSDCLAYVVDDNEIEEFFQSIKP